MFAPRSAAVEQLAGNTPTCVQDFRRVLDGPVTITPHNPAHLRYGLWIQPDVPDAQKLNRQWNTFAPANLLRSALIWAYYLRPQ